MRKIFKIGLLLSCFSAWSQVGIGTHRPDSSAVLEIQSSSQGMLLPKHEFSVFNSNKTPINLPKTGTLVYNTSTGTHSDNIAMKGIYVWDGKKWNQLLNVDGTDKLLTIRMGRSTGAQDIEFIQDKSDNALQYITFYKDKYVVTSTFTEELAVNEELITIPKGFYRVEVSFDGWNKTTKSGDASSFLPGYLGLFVKECVLHDENDVPLANPRVLSIISSEEVRQSIQGYTFTFFFKIEKTTKVKVGLRNAEGTSNNMGFWANQNGVSIKFRRYFD